MAPGNNKTMNMVGRMKEEAAASEEKPANKVELINSGAPEAVLNSPEIKQITKEELADYTTQKASDFNKENEVLINTVDTKGLDSDKIAEVKKVSIEQQFIDLQKKINDFVDKVARQAIGEPVVQTEVTPVVQTETPLEEKQKIDLGIENVEKKQRGPGLFKKITESFKAGYKKSTEHLASMGGIAWKEFDISYILTGETTKDRLIKKSQQIKEYTKQEIEFAKNLPSYLIEKDRQAKEALVDGIKSLFKGLANFAKTSYENFQISQAEAKRQYEERKNLLKIEKYTAKADKNNEKLQVLIAKNNQLKKIPAFFKNKAERTMGAYEVAEVISDSVFNNFVDNKGVPENILATIAQKIKETKPFSKRELAIMSDKDQSAKIKALLQPSAPETPVAEVAPETPVAEQPVSVEKNLEVTIGELKAQMQIMMQKIEALLAQKSNAAEVIAPAVPVAEVASVLPNNSAEELYYTENPKNNVPAQPAPTEEYYTDPVSAPVNNVTTSYGSSENFVYNKQPEKTARIIPLNSSVNKAA